MFTPKGGEDLSPQCNRTESMTETMRVLRISTPPVKRLKSRPIISNESLNDLEYRMSDHSISTRIRELSPPNKRKVPSAKQKKMIMQIALHSDISSFSNGSTNSSGSGSITGPPDIIPEDLRSLYSNTPKERALVLYKPPSEFLPNLVNGSQAPSSPSSRSPKSPLTNSFPLNNDNEESMDI